MRKNVKGFIAKLLVLCMFVGLLPVVTLAAPADGGRTDDTYYAIKLDTAVTGGTVSVTYTVNGDTNTHQLDNNSYYRIGSDATKLEFTFTADGSHTFTSATYKIGNDTARSFTVTSNKGEIPLSVFSGKNGRIEITINAVFTTTSSGGSPSGGGGGGGGGSSTSPDKVEVKAESKTSGTTTTAAVSQNDMDKAVDSAVKAAEKAGTAPKIEVKVDTSDKTTAVSVDLPVNSLETLVKAKGATLSITSNVADIVLDSASTKALAEQAAGGTVTITVKPAASLNNAQKETVKDATVIDVSVTSGGKQITSFGGGVLSISVKYTLPSGVAAADVQVFYLTDGGALQAHKTSYAGGKVTFTTTHLSKYVIGTKDMAGVSFDDVVIGSYYFDAVAWAARNNITAGITATMFGPDQSCTRAQIVTFLWRAAGSPEPAAKANPFADVASDAYYYKAVLWAVEKGITAGTSATTFSPNKTCTRAEAVTFLYRSEGSPAASGTGSFTDVPDGAYYKNAVAWAVKKNVTAGTSATTFSPDQTCTRAQIVTFLYRNVVVV